MTNEFCSSLSKSGIIDVGTAVVMVSTVVRETAAVLGVAVPDASEEDFSSNRMFGLSHEAFGFCIQSVIVGQMVTVEVAENRLCETHYVIEAVMAKVKFVSGP